MLLARKAGVNRDARIECHGQKEGAVATGNVHKSKICCGLSIILAVELTRRLGPAFGWRSPRDVAFPAFALLDWPAGLQMIRPRGDRIAVAVLPTHRFLGMEFLPGKFLFDAKLTRDFDCFFQRMRKSNTMRFVCVCIFSLPLNLFRLILFNSRSGSFLPFQTGRILPVWSGGLRLVLTSTGRRVRLTFVNPGMVEKDVEIGFCYAALLAFNKLEFDHFTEVFTDGALADAKLGGQGSLPGKAPALFAGMLGEPGVGVLCTLTDLVTALQPVGNHRADEHAPWIDAEWAWRGFAAGRQRRRRGGFAIKWAAHGGGIIRWHRWFRGGIAPARRSRIMVYEAPGSV